MPTRVDHGHGCCFQRARQVPLWRQQRQEMRLQASETMRRSPSTSPIDASKRR
jgi:hypothetical protein